MVADPNPKRRSPYYCRKQDQDLDQWWDMDEKIVFLGDLDPIIWLFAPILNLDPLFLSVRRIRMVFILILIRPSRKRPDPDPTLEKKPGSYLIYT